MNLDEIRDGLQKMLNNSVNYGYDTILKEVLSFFRGFIPDKYFYTQKEYFKVDFDDDNLFTILVKFNRKQLVRIIFDAEEDINGNFTYSIEEVVALKKEIVDKQSLKKYINEYFIAQDISHESQVTSFYCLFRSKGLYVEDVKELIKKYNELSEEAKEELGF